MKDAPPRIAIPLPHSLDPDYAGRAIPQYERAVEMAGGQPVRVPLDQNAAGIMKVIEGCDGVLLPGNKADIDPAKFHAKRSAHTAAADSGRDAVDNILLRDAYEQRKPVLGICYGLQSLNVYRAGSLIQHIPDFLPEETRAKVNHDAGKKVAVAHTVEIEEGSNLARVVRRGSTSGAEVRMNEEDGIATLEALRHPKADCLKSPPRSGLVLPVNSSHHQSADSIGEGLRIVARCPDDGIIEALEGTAPDHFVLAVQWHPERSVDDDEPSRAIFHALVEAAAKRATD